MKKVSVIIPVYNVEKYLNKCVDSVINQTYKNLEIILVDDGSLDNCPKLCDDYAKSDERIKVIHKINEGVSVARNVGISVASGEYVCFFDSDDFVEEDVLEKMLDAIVEKAYDVCVCGYSVDIYNKEGEKESASEVVPWKQVCENLSLIECEKNLGICGYAWNKLYRKEFLTHNGLFFEEGTSLIEDLLFNSMAISKGAKVCFLPYAGYHYIQRQRETLGVKYYENFFDLKQKAIKAKSDVLRVWGVKEAQIEDFCNGNFIDSVCGTIKNIKKARL